MSHKTWVWIFFLAFVTGCTGKQPGVNTPQRALSEYVGITFAVKTASDKTKLMSYMSGEAREKLAALPDAEFERYFVESKKEFVSLKVRDERKLSEDRYALTYEITYNSRGPAIDPLIHQIGMNRVINKKHVIFVKDSGRWLISEIQNLKTLIELKDETNL